MNALIKLIIGAKVSGFFTMSIFMVEYLTLYGNNVDIMSEVFYTFSESVCCLNYALRELNEAEAGL